MGLRAPTMSPASASLKPPNHSQQPDRQAPSATMTHCSASSLHVQRHVKGLKQQHSPLASDGVKPLGRIHEVSADSEEGKSSSSVGRCSASPEPSSAPSGTCGPCGPSGPCGGSFSKREASGELQSASGGTFLIVEACISMQGGDLGAAGEGAKGRWQPWAVGREGEGVHAEETPCLPHDVRLSTAGLS